MFAGSTHQGNIIAGGRMSMGREGFACWTSSQAGGLAILTSKNLDAQVDIVALDRLSHYMIVKVSVEDRQFILVNAYFPTADVEILKSVLYII